MPLDMSARTGTRNASHQPSRLVAEWAAQIMSQAIEAPPVYEGWTPQMAGEAFCAALRWAKHSAGRVGPSGMICARFPEAILTDEEHAEMGWGLKEVADPDDLPPMRVLPTPAQVSRHEAALTWPSVYLVGEGREGSARMVGLWAACKVRRQPFAAAVKARGVSRGAAYQLRDRGLSIISQGLQRDGVPISV